MSATWTYGVSITRKPTLPLPSRVKGEHAVALPAHLAAKAAVYSAWKKAGFSKSEFARRLRRNETEVRRILDPHHGTKLDQLEEAAHALGGARGVVRGGVIARAVGLVANRLLAARRTTPASLSSAASSVASRLAKQKRTTFLTAASA
jgi:hypothetical protein